MYKPADKSVDDDTPCWCAVMVGAQQQQRSGGKFECGAQQTMGKGGCTGQRTVLADVTHRFVKAEEGAQVNRVEIASRGIEVRLGRSHGAPAAAVPPNVGKNSVSRMR